MKVFMTVHKTLAVALLCGAGLGASADTFTGRVVAPSATVYVTRTGAAYHRPTCRYAGASAAALSRSEALRRGLRACKVCTP